MRSRTIKIGNFKFKVKIEETKNKHVYAKIKADTIILRVPSVIESLNEIENVLFEKLEKYELKSIDKDLLSGFILFGKPYKMIVKEIKKKYVINHSKSFIVLNPHYKNDFINYLEKKLEEYIKTIVTDYKKVLNLDFQPQIIIKPLKSKYGYVDIEKRKLCLSSFLVHFPKKLIEYIVAHEMVHFLVPKHGKIFNLFLSHFLPNHRKLEMELKKFSIIMECNEIYLKYFMGTKQFSDETILNRSGEKGYK